jgi:hypothetical protein
MKMPSLITLSPQQRETTHNAYLVAEKYIKDMLEINPVLE